MKRKVLLQLVVPLLGLCVLFLLMTLDPVQTRYPAEPLELSVLLRESDATSYTAARQGMEQAAADLDVELRFLTLATANSAQEQQELLAREVDGGADGVVLVPAEREALSAAVERLSGRAAVVTLETDLSAAGAKGCISVDNAALGTALAQAALNGAVAGDTVLLLDSVGGGTGVQDRLAAAVEVLEREGRVVRVCRPASEGQSLADALEESLRKWHPALVMAFEPAALETAQWAVQTMESPPLLYGMGATSTIVAGLEQGWITAIAAQNEFAAGYLAVAAAVRSIEKTPAQMVAPLEFSILRRENMYEADSQKLLFPVTR